MWPFRKRKNKSPIPNEVQEYYQSERRERVGVAWLLALATLVTTVLLAFGLYVGGRWVYRKVTKNDKPTTTVTTKDNKTKTTEDKNADQKKSSDQSGSKNNSGTSNPPSSQNNDGATSNDVVSDGDDTDNDAPATTTPSTPKPTQNTNTALSNTGPGDTVAVFFGVSAVATTGHYLYHRRRQQKA